MWLTMQPHFFCEIVREITELVKSLHIGGTTGLRDVLTTVQLGVVHCQWPHTAQDPTACSEYREFTAEKYSCELLSWWISSFVEQAHSSVVTSLANTRSESTFKCSLFRLQLYRNFTVHARPVWLRVRLQTEVQTVYPSVLVVRTSVSPTQGS